jgi:hypothetical protein
MLQQLIDILARYVNETRPDAITLDELEEWLVLHLQAILDSGDEMAVDIVNTLDPSLVELREDLMNEAALFAAAEAMFRRALVDTHPLPTPELVTTPSSGSDTYRSEANQGGRLVLVGPV